MDTSNKKEEFASMLQENKIAVKQEGEKFQQYFCALIASVGALLVGCVLAWTSPALVLLDNTNSTAPLHLTNKEESSWIAAWTPIGAIIGALPAGIIANWFGRKRSLIIFTVPLIGTWLLTALARSVTVLYVARFIIGILIGLFCSVLPMYVNEIAEDSVRGTLGTLFQLFLTLGILLDYGLDSLKSYYILNYTLLGVTILFFFLLFFIPESPIHLLSKGHNQDADKSLRRLRGRHYDVSAELNELRKPLEEAAGQTFSFSTILTAVNIKALIISVGLMMGQQLSGINAVIFFASKIFAAAGASSPAMCTIVIGIVQSLATVVSSVLIEKAGRKMLLIISGAGMAVCLLALGYFFHLQESSVDVSKLGWLPLSSMGCFIIVFSLGFGPIPWLMGGEVMAPEIKGFGSGLTVAVNYICVALVTFFFQPLSELLSSAYTFWLFAIIAMIACVFVILVVPETKGKSIQQIQDELAGLKLKKHLNGHA